MSNQSKSHAVSHHAEPTLVESQIVESPINSSPNWNTILNQAFRDPIQLLDYLDLNTPTYRDLIDTDNAFSMLVPRAYAAKMKKGDWNDPLLKQVLPVKNENIKTTGFKADPVGDLNAEVSPGVLHKYQGRLLLVTTGACPVHCRYCFRREYPYAESTPNKKHWQTTVEKIRQDESIKEVILSGGDPLMLSDDRLQKICDELEAIPHVTTLRFHTRVPLFLPERVTTFLLDYLDSLTIKVVMVIHCNHANELDKPVADCLNELHKHGITLLNQSVILRGVNDSVCTLVELSQRLFDCHVLPYYLHQLDKVQGAAHFEVDPQQSMQLLEDLKNNLPGYLVPKLVQEVAGKKAKQALVKAD